jgi:hypothetical protein
MVVRRFESWAGYAQHGHRPHRDLATNSDRGIIQRAHDALDEVKPGIKRKVVLGLRDSRGALAWGPGRGTASAGT